MSELHQHDDNDLRAIIAHRGAPLNYPENSLAGYKAVLNLAMLYPHLHCFMEMDVRCVKGATDTCNDVAVAMHDNKIDRTIEGGKGKPGALRFDDLVCMPMRSHKSMTPIDFQRLNSKRIPLLTIHAPNAQGCGDYRVPSIEEILELTLAVNKRRLNLGHDSPVGLILDLKDEQTFPALAATINRFVATHPDSHGKLPLVSLALGAFVKPENHDAFHALLTPEAELHFHDKSLEEHPELIRTTNLHTDLTGPFHDQFISATRAALTNAASPFRMIGDPDPSSKFSTLGSNGRKLAGNFPTVNNETEINKALERQHLIFTDDVLTAFRCLDHYQSRQKSR